MSQEDLRELFVDELKDLYSAEKQLVAAATGLGGELDVTA